MTTFRWTFGVLLFVVSTQSSFACQGSAVILDENFKTPERGWDQADKQNVLSYGPTGAVLKLSEKTSFSVFDWNFTSDGTDLCTTALWPSAGLKAGQYATAAGISFWAKDYSNFYMASVRNDGQFLLSRMIADNWQTIIPETDIKDVVHMAPGASNEIEVQISGPKGLLFINGKKVADFVGQPPPGSGTVGLIGVAHDKAMTLVFPNFRISTYP